MASLFTAPQFDGGTGITPEDGLQLFFFEEGTNTPKNTFTDEALTIAHAHPVVSLGNGVFEEIWMAEGDRYTIDLKNKNDVLAGFGAVSLYIAGVTTGEGIAALTESIYTATPANVVALRLLTPAAGDTANTKGWSILGVGAATYDAVAGSTTSIYGDQVSATVGVYWQIRKGDTIFAERYGITYSGADELAQIQAAIDDNEGAEIVLGGQNKTVLISDTLYLPRGTTLRGIGSSDAWSGRTKGVSISTIGAGTARIWTDIATESRPFDSTWFDLEDAPITVMIITEGDSKLQNIAVVGQSTNTWDIGIFNPACKRVTHINVDTSGEFDIAGYYIDATWSDRNVNLVNLHTNSYRTVNPDAGPNELYHENCWYNGGIVGCMGKGNDRNPELANDETTDLVWAWGGVSDHTWISVRFGNTPVGDDILAHGAYFDWGYARDVNDKDSKYPGNHYFYGVSFRTGQGGRYALCIDRSSYDNILGAYGETRTSVLTTLITDTTAAVPEEVVSPNPSVGINGVSFKIKTTDTSGAFNVRTTPWTIGATVTATSGGSFKIEGVGFDGSNQFFITKTITGTVGSGDTLTQAAGQAIAETAVSNDRTQQTSVNGQLIVTTASNTSSHTGTRSLLYPRAIIAGMLIREDEISALVQGSINMTSTGTHALESAGTIKTTGATNEIRSTGAQVNLYTDSGVSNVRLRWAGTSLDSYTGADLGSSARRWDTLFATNGTINTSDEREKTELLELDAKETACAKELKSAIRKFKFNDAVTEKGDKARIHFGVGAQTVGDIFRSNDLDPDEYAIFCYDEWDEELEENEAGEMVLTQEPGNRYGIRYEELLCFIVSAL